MADAKKKNIIRRELDEEMAEIDAALDAALGRLDEANSRVDEVLQKERGISSETKDEKENATSPDS